MYIPKSVIVGLLFAAIGLVGGWMLHGSANEVSRFPAIGIGDLEPRRLALPRGSTATVRDAVFI